MKYTVKDFNAQYKTDDDCLNEVFNNRFGSLKECPSCKKSTKFYRVNGRKCWACPWCSHQIHPLAGTIFSKSETSLKSWFFAIFLFSNSKNGVSAMELTRQLGVTYKTAWRMAQQIRKLLNQANNSLSGVVEIDETYYGKKSNRPGGRGDPNKSPIMGAVERGGKVRAKVLPSVKHVNVMPFITKNVQEKALLMTDNYRGYKHLNRIGYGHEFVNHGAKQYVKDGVIHTNTIEGFWSQLKRSLRGTYHFVSRKHLQSYVDEFCYRYNHRFDGPLFPSMIRQAAKPV